MADIDPKSKKSTMDHMNKDHSLDLGLYLRHVNGLSAEQLAAEGVPEMVDLDLTAMHIRTSTSGTVHVVPLNPPMAAWGERRKRLIDLALEARTAFGVALPEHGPPSSNAAPAAKQPIPFRAPRGFDIALFGGVVFYAFVAYLVFTGNDVTATRVWISVLGAVGVTEHNFYFGGAEGFRLMVRLMALPVLAIHVTELWWLDRTRLAPHGMKRFSCDWSLWMGSTFWEGFTAFKRFDRQARKAAQEAAAGKH